MKFTLFIISFVILFILLFVLGINTGSFNSNYSDVLDAIFSYNHESLVHFSIVNLRIPRVLLSFMIGGALAASGYLMQISINNPLAEPFILGTSSAASLGANLVFFGLVPMTFLGLYMPSYFAFGFSLGCTLLVIQVAKRNGFVESSKMLLAGIAMSSLLTSIVALLAFKSDSNEKLRSIIFWVMGSFNNAKWSQLPFIALLLFVTITLFTFLSKPINLLLLGTEKAADLGLNIKFYNKLIIVFAVLLASTCVTLSGAVGFVGLLIPHFIRAVFGVTYKYNILNSVLLGGLFLMFCDLISKWLYPPVGIPIGIITSFFGVPFFVYLLLNKNYTFE